MTNMRYEYISARAIVPGDCSRLRFMLSIPILGCKSAIGSRVIIIITSWCRTPEKRHFYLYSCIYSLFDTNHSNNKIIIHRGVLFVRCLLLLLYYVVVVEIIRVRSTKI